MVVSPGQKLSDKDRATLTKLLADTVVAANDDLSDREDFRLAHADQLIETPAYD